MSPVSLSDFLQMGIPAAVYFLKKPQIHLVYQFLRLKHREVPILCVVCTRCIETSLYYRFDTGVDPISWTCRPLDKEHEPCHEQSLRMRRSCASGF